MSRVCIIRHYYYPEDPRSRREAEALAAEGHEVDMLTLRHPGEPAREVINGVNVRRLPVGHYRRSLFHYAYEYSAFFVLAFLVLTFRLVRKRYDVVQVNSLPDFLVFAAASCKLFRVPIVLDMHECTPELFCTKYQKSSRHPAVRLLIWIEQRSLAFATRVITCTPQQRALFASRGTPARKITVVLNAANSAIFRPRTEKPVLWKKGGEFRLVAHGLIAERYGLDTMVNAVSLLKNDIPGIRLHVYGKGDYQQQLEALVEQLKLEDQVIIHGFVPEEELLDGIASAHVGVIAVKRDTFRDMTQTQKMYEYVAMHKPVVISDTPAVRTHFDNNCFQFFASDDPQELASALLALYNDPARAESMIEASSECYRAYSWEAQREVYCNAVLGAKIPSRREQTIHEAPTTHPAWPIESVVMSSIPMENSPVLPAADFGLLVSQIDDTRFMRSVAVPAAGALSAKEMAGLGSSVDDLSIYVTGIVTPLEDGSAK